MRGPWSNTGKRDRVDGLCCRYPARLRSSRGGRGSEARVSGSQLHTGAHPCEGDVSVCTRALLMTRVLGLSWSRRALSLSLALRWPRGACRNISSATMFKRTPARGVCWTSATLWPATYNTGMRPRRSGRGMTGSRQVELLALWLDESILFKTSDATSETPLHCILSLA